MRGGDEEQEGGDGEEEETHHSSTPCVLDRFPYDRPRGASGRTRGRRARGGASSRAASVDADPLVPHARDGRLPQGRAPPAHRLVQAARRAHEARVAATSEKARGVIGISAGNHAQAVAWGAARGRARRARRDVARRERGEDRRDAGLRRVGRPRGGGPGRGVRATRRSSSRRPAGRSSIPSTTRCTIAGQGTVGLEILEDVARRRHDRRRRSAAAGSIAGSRRRAAGSARVVGVEPERSTAMQLGARRGRARRRDADVDRGRAERPARRATRARRSSRSSWSRGRARDRGGDRGGVPVPLRAREARLRAGGRGGRRGRPRGEGRTGGRTVCIVSGGNVAAETAAGILAGR